MSRAFVPLVVLLAGLLVPFAPAAQARKPKRCPGGAFRANMPLLPVTTTDADALIVGTETAALVGGCPAGGLHVRRTRRWTKLTARWLACDGVAGKVRMKARIDASTCRTMRGTVRAPKGKFRRKFTAQLSQGTVHGAAAVPASALADVDTADVGVAGDNDSIATAQPVSLLSTVGGAAFSNGADAFDDDYYRIELNGQPVTITLAIGDSRRTDLDLFLVDANRQDVVPPSRGTSSVEQVTTTTQTGTAYVIVFSYFGPNSEVQANPWTGYVLSIGQGPAMLPSEADFVPGEVVAQMRPPGGLLALTAGRAQRVAGGGRSALFRMPEPTRLLTRMAGVEASPLHPEGRRVKDFAGMSDLVRNRARTLDALDEMRQRPDVAHAEPNLVFHPRLVPNDEHYGFQWHYPLIGLPEAWDLTQGSADVVAAVVDTGILSSTVTTVRHPDLDPARIMPGFDFIDTASNARDGDGIDGDPFDNGDGRRGVGSSFHGSHVAGTIAAATNNGIGVAGIDWNARLLPVRVLGVDGGTSYDIAQGIRYAAGLPNDSGTVPAQRADVINLSLGGPGYSAELRAAVQAARAAGCIIVVAAGNDDIDASGDSPGSFPEVVTVSAADLTRGKAPYSDYGSVVDIAAPGGNTEVDRNGDGYADGVLSLGADDTGGTLSFRYVFYQGTSMATPHVAGVVTLMQAAHLAANGRRFTPDEFDDWLRSGQLTDPPAPADVYWSGNGLVNARRAVERAAGMAGTLPPGLGVSPTSVSFGSDLSDVTVALNNTGTGSLTIESVTTSDAAAWLSATTSSPLPFAAPGTLTLHAERAGLPAGTVQTASVTVVSSAGTRVVPVAMQVPAGSLGGDVGRVYALLIDAVTREARYQVSADRAGSYRLDFPTPVLTGSYFLAAGTDRDADGVIGDAGEAFGIWPGATSEPAVVTVGADQSLDLTLPVLEAVSVAAGQFRVGAAPSRWELPLLEPATPAAP